MSAEPVSAEQVAQEAALDIHVQHGHGFACVPGLCEICRTATVTEAALSRWGEQVRREQMEQDCKAALEDLGHTKAIEACRAIRRAFQAEDKANG